MDYRHTLTSLATLLLFLCLSSPTGTAFAAQLSENDGEIAATLESQRELFNTLGNGTYEFKDTVNCERLITRTDPIYPSRGAINFYVCPDLTISFPQPDSSGFSGWNGKCGQTAVSNLSGMLCHRYINPDKVDSYASDLTPGNRPATNLKALKKIFDEDYLRRRTGSGCPQGTWKEYTSSSENKFLEDLQSSLWNGPGKYKRKRKNGTTITINPVAVLLSAGLKSHHWVTLVDFQRNKEDRFGCDAIMNTWGSQKIMTCEDLVRAGYTTFYGYRYLTLIH